MAFIRSRPATLAAAWWRRARLCKRGCTLAGRCQFCRNDGYCPNCRTFQGRMIDKRGVICGASSCRDLEAQPCTKCIGIAVNPRIGESES